MHTRKLLFTLALGLGLSLTLLTLPLLATADVARPSVVNHPTSAPAVISITQLNPSQDNTLYEIGDGSLSNGAGAYFFVGKTEDGPVRRGLIQFDVAGALPADAIILSATLQLSATRAPIGGGAEAIALHPVTASWGEGTSDASEPGGSGAPAALDDATWLHRFYSSTFWTTAGGDFVLTASAVLTVEGTGVYTWSSPDMAADLQSWLAVPATNHGWILIGDEATPQTAKRFNTRENLDAESRPILSVAWVLPASKIYLPLISRQ